MRSELTSGPPDYILTNGALAFVFGAVSQTRRAGRSVALPDTAHMAYVPSQLHFLPDSYPW